MCMEQHAISFHQFATLYTLLVFFFFQETSSNTISCNGRLKKRGLYSRRSQPTVNAPFTCSFFFSSAVTCKWALLQNASHKVQFCRKTPSSACWLGEMYAQDVRNQSTTAKYRRFHKGFWVLWESLMWDLAAIYAVRDCSRCQMKEFREFSDKIGENWWHVFEFAV